MRIMAIDYGDAHTGIAISDATGLLAGYTTTIHTRLASCAVNQIDALAKEYQVETLVLGLPKNMNGTEGPRAEKCREFGRQLETATALPVVLWDERRTTIDAHRLLHAAKKKQKSHKKTVDAVAASLILEGYLTRLRHP